MAVVCMLFTFSIFLLPFAGLYWAVVAFAVLYGFASSAPLTISPLLTSDNLGMKNFGTIYGILTITINIGGAIGPVAAGYFYDFQKTYLPIFYLFAVFMLVALLCTILIKPATKPTDSRDMPARGNRWH
jgi:MFS family permease